MRAVLRVLKILEWPLAILAGLIMLLGLPLDLLIDVLRHWGLVPARPPASPDGQLGASMRQLFFSGLVTLAAAMAVTCYLLFG
jgi:hypothetical protein